jgi:hypothetical protein
LVWFEAAAKQDIRRNRPLNIARKCWIVTFAMLPVLEFEARPVIRVEDAVRVELGL